MTRGGKNLLRSLRMRAATTKSRLRNAKPSVNEEELERWEYLLDPSRCSIQEFIENFKVSTKEVQDDGTVQQRIRLWPAQVKILEAIAAEWAAGRAAKLVIVKDREQGCSFFIQALFYERFLRGGGGEMRTVSHKDEATRSLQTDFHSLRLQTPDFVFTDILRAEWVNDAEGRWKMMWPTKHFSTARTMTCRDGAMGRGDRTRWAHYSEYPWWSTGKANIGGAIATLRDTPGNIYVFESTGKDFDEFYELANNAREGRNGWTCLFLSWLTHPGKRAYFRTEVDRLEFSQTVGRIEKYDRGEELAIFDETGGDLERLKWRREQIDGPVCNGDVAFFAREHPRIFHHAFYADSDCVFESSVLDSRMEPSRDLELRTPIGNIEVQIERGKAKATFQVSRTGTTRVYRMPEKGKNYCFGADPSQGKKVADQGRRTGDYSTIVMIEVETQEVCAIYRAHTPPEDFAAAVYGLSLFYGWAPGYVESNNDGRTVIYVCGELDSLWCPPDSPLLAQRRRVPTKNGETFEHHVGFLTDSTTKPVAINRLIRWVREMGPWKPGDPAKIPLQLLLEMRLYVRVQTVTRRGTPTGRVSMEASRGHDDTISAAWMAWEAAEWLKQHPDEMTAAAGPGLDDESARYLAAARAELGLVRVNASDYLKHPRGQAPGMEKDPAVIPDMAGF